MLGRVPSDLRYVPHVPRHISRLSRSWVPPLLPSHFPFSPSLVAVINHRSALVSLPFDPPRTPSRTKHGHDTRPWATSESTHHRIKASNREKLAPPRSPRCCRCLLLLLLPPQTGCSQGHRAPRAVRYRSVPGLAPVTLHTNIHTHTRTHTHIQVLESRWRPQDHRNLPIVGIVPTGPRSSPQYSSTSNLPTYLPTCLTCPPKPQAQAQAPRSQVPPPVNEPSSSPSSPCLPAPCSQLASFPASPK